MKFRSMHQNNQEDKIKGLPDFLQILHKKKPIKVANIETQQNESEYESILVPYDKKNRYAINADTDSSSESDSQLIQIIRDPRTQCQNINKRIFQARKCQNCEQMLYEILIKYISIVNPVKDLKKLQPLIDSLSCFYSEIEPLILKVSNKLCQGLIYQKFAILDKSFHALLYYIKSLIFCEKNKAKNSNEMQKQKQSNLKDCFLRLVKICQKQFWQSRKQTNFINLLQNVQVLIESQYEMKISLINSDSLIDFLFFTIKKICSNLSPRMIKNSFFEVHCIQLNSQIYKMVGEEFFLTLKTNEPFYKSAWKCFQISAKKNKKLKRRIQSKAITVSKICNFCHLHLFEDHLVKVYGCGHSFHSYCDSKKQYCIECSYISDEHKFQKIIFSKVYQRPSQQNCKKKTQKTHKAQKAFREQKQEKTFYLRRKLKMYDYEQYSRQKITMSLMHSCEQVFL